jgi:hypothetical protein
MSRQRTLRLWAHRIYRGAGRLVQSYTRCRRLPVIPVSEGRSRRLLISEVWEDEGIALCSSARQP